MRRLVLCWLASVQVNAYPSFLVGSNCGEPIAIANGQSPGFGGIPQCQGGVFPTNLETE